MCLKFAYILQPIGSCLPLFEPHFISVRVAKAFVFNVDLSERSNYSKYEYIIAYIFDYLLAVYEVIEYTRLQKTHVVLVYLADIFPLIAGCC